MCKELGLAEAVDAVGSDRQPDVSELGRGESVAGAQAKDRAGVRRHDDLEHEVETLEIDRDGGEQMRPEAERATARADPEVSKMRQLGQRRHVIARVAEVE